MSGTYCWDHGHLEDGCQTCVAPYDYPQFGANLIRSGRETRDYRRTDWSDLALLVGPTMRWTQDAYEDLQTLRPEVLLGYQVRLTTFSLLIQSRDCGREASKVVILEDGMAQLGDARTNRDLNDYVHWQLERRGTKVEAWRVHRVRGTERVW